MEQHARSARVAVRSQARFVLGPEVGKLEHFLLVTLLVSRIVLSNLVANLFLIIVSILNEDSHLI